MKENIRFKVNGKHVSPALDPERMLIWVLRTELGLTGTKHGCDEGFCGTCTVLVNNEPERSCRFPMKNVQGKNVLTIEGLAKNGKLHPLQEAFVEHNAMQCGFCTSGMILSAYSFLLKTPQPTREAIIRAMDDNFCRCGSHTRVIRAIETAASRMKGGRR